jgi:phage terminase small subunit
MRPSRVNYQEPDPPPPTDLKPPAELKGKGLALWRQYAEPMTKTGQLRSTDMPLFIRHCRTAMDIEAWEKELRKAGLERSEKLQVQRLLNALGTRFIREAAELGMTSISRSRVKTVVKPPVEKPKHDRFFGGIKGVIQGGRK